MSFVLLTDDLKKPYFRFVSSTTNNFSPFDAPVPSSPDITSFLDQDLSITPLTQTKFSKDLFRRDELLLAILSLFLLLLLQNLVSIILLHTHHNKVSTFTFAIKHVLDLTRNFHLSRLFFHSSNSRRQKPNPKLIIIALFVILFTFGLELLVLILTNQTLTKVANSEISLQLRHPFNPSWRDVRYHNRASLNRPCVAISLRNVEQGGTRISACVTSNLSSTTFEPLTRISTPINMTFQTDVHVYGAEHLVCIDGIIVKYSARAFYNLDEEEEESRIMVDRTRRKFVSQRIRVLHRQLIAMLFSFYVRETEDDTVTIETLQQLDIKWFPDPLPPPDGHKVVVTQVLEKGGKVRDITVDAERSFTVITGGGVIPRGPGAFRILQQGIKGSLAVGVRKFGNESDLFVGSGIREKKGVVWREKGRVLNWLGLVCCLAVLGVVGILLRCGLRPVGMGEIAGGGIEWERE